MALQSDSGSLCASERQIRGEEFHRSRHDDQTDPTPRELIPEIHHRFNRIRLRRHLKLTSCGGPPAENRRIQKVLPRQRIQVAPVEEPAVPTAVGILVATPELTGDHTLHPRNEPLDHDIPVLERGLVGHDIPQHPVVGRLSRLKHPTGRSSRSHGLNLVPLGPQERNHIPALRHYPPRLVARLDRPEFADVLYQRHRHDQREEGEGQKPVHARGRIGVSDFGLGDFLAGMMMVVSHG